MHKIVTVTISISMFVALLITQAIPAEQKPGVTNQPRVAPKTPPTDPPTTGPTYPTDPAPTKGGTSARPSGRPGEVPGGQYVAPPIGPTSVPATISLDCGGKKYTVSTGTNKGNCETAIDGKSATCNDGGYPSGNTSQASCASGCIQSTGAGSCTMK